MFLTHIKAVFQSFFRRRFEVSGATVSLDCENDLNPCQIKPETNHANAASTVRYTAVGTRETGRMLNKKGSRTVKVMLAIKVKDVTKKTFRTDVHFYWRYISHQLLLKRKVIRLG